MPDAPDAEQIASALETLAAAVRAHGPELARLFARAVAPPSSGAERQRRYRERLKARKASEVAAAEPPFRAAEVAPAAVAPDMAPSAPVPSLVVTQDVLASTIMAMANAKAADAEKPRPKTKADREKRGTQNPSYSGDPDVLDAWLKHHKIPMPEDNPEVRAFLDYHSAKGTRSLDWAASWRTWRERAKERKANGGRWPGKPKPGGPPEKMPTAIASREYMRTFSSHAELDAFRAANGPGLFGREAMGGR